MMKGFLLVVLLGLTGCAGTPPFADYMLAQTALNSARKADASQYSPGNWAKADEAYTRGEIAYQNRDYGKARDSFRKARLYSEKAENVARLKKFQSGGVE